MRPLKFQILLLKNMFTFIVILTTLPRNTFFRRRQEAVEIRHEEVPPAAPVRNALVATVEPEREQQLARAPSRARRHKLHPQALSGSVRRHQGGGRGLLESVVLRKSQEQRLQVRQSRRKSRRRSLSGNLHQRTQVCKIQMVELGKNRENYDCDET